MNRPGPWVGAGRSCAVPNTLGVACAADEVRLVTDEESLAASFDDARAHDMPVTVMGGGSNLVLLSRLPGMALQVGIRGQRFERLDTDRWRVTAGAGETWHDIVTSTLARGIGGLENLALIPGSVGAAPVQNIGAYGRELSECLESVRVFDRQRIRFETIPGSECGFGYRESRFKQEDADRYVITGITMELGSYNLATDYPDVTRELDRRGGTVDASAVAEAVTTVRRRKLPDPSEIGNVGSFFKNPFVTPRRLDAIRDLIDIDDYPVPGSEERKIPAARLIDHAGWKGVRHGPVQVWPRQPLVLVNLGGATGRQVLDLAERIRDDVERKYGVGLQHEPSVKGVD